jgi:hypothetical protein
MLNVLQMQAADYCLKGRSTGIFRAVSRISGHPEHGFPPEEAGNRALDVATCLLLPEWHEK